MAGERKLPRVFVGPIEVAAYYTRLAENLRAAGVEAVAVDLYAHEFRYERGPRPPIWVRMAEAAGRLDVKLIGRPILLRTPVRLLAIATRVSLFLWAIAKFDVFVFGFGQTLFDTRELPILRALGKRLVFVFNGSDARPPFVDGAMMRRSGPRTAADAARLTLHRKNRLRRIERYADAVVSQPAFSQLFERPVVDFFRIGIPWVDPPSPTARAQSASAGVRILHSPSDPEVKGSDRIKDVIAGLVADGYPLEFIELRGVANEVVRREIAACDFVVDQIYSDAPMVGFATEAAAAGKPSIVGGYAWPELRRIYDAAAMPPVEQCRPETLRDAVVRLATDVKYRTDLGARAEQFVRGPWAQSAIASRYLSLFRGDLGPEFYFDPRKLEYVRGVGFDEDAVRGLVKSVLEVGGPQALQVADKPELEQLYVDFAAGRS